MVSNEIGTMCSVPQDFHFYSISLITAIELKKKKIQGYNEIIYFFQYIKNILS